MTKDATSINDDIGVYLDPSELEKKKWKVENNKFTYITVPRIPSSICPNRVLVASEGFWKGFFTIRKMDYFQGKTRLILGDFFWIVSGTEDVEEFEAFKREVPEIHPIHDVIRSDASWDDEKRFSDVPQGSLSEVK